MAGSFTPATAGPPSRVCVSIGHAAPEELLKLAELESERGETFFEFCLEFLRNPQDGPGVVQELLHRRPKTWVIVTCRRGERNFQGSIEEQLALLTAAVDAGARGVDLEVESARYARPWLESIGQRCTRIVSYHNYIECPPLEPVIQELESFPAELIKIAVRTSEMGALCRLMQAARDCTKPNLMLAMDEGGFPTRILGPILGRSFTYASPGEYEGTAAGQPSAHVLRTLYRLDEIDSKTEFVFTSSQPGADKITDRVVAVQNQRSAAARENVVHVRWPDPESVPGLLLSER